ELPAALPFGTREAREKVLVHTAERVLRPISRAAEGDVAHEIDDLPEALLIEAGTGVVLREDALEGRVVALDRRHGIVNELTNRRLRRHRLEVLPARLGRHPEDANRAVLVRIFRIGALRLLRQELFMLCLERVGDVLEKDQAEDDMLVLGCIHVVAERISRGPER